MFIEFILALFLIFSTLIWDSCYRIKDQWCWAWDLVTSHSSEISFSWTLSLPSEKITENNKNQRDCPVSFSSQMQRATDLLGWMLPSSSAPTGRVWALGLVGGRLAPSGDEWSAGVDCAETRGRCWAIFGVFHQRCLRRTGLRWRVQTRSPVLFT